MFKNGSGYKLSVNESSSSIYNIVQPVIISNKKDTSPVVANANNDPTLYV